MSLWDKLRLKSGNPQTRRKIVDRLATSKSLEAVELLITCLCDEDEMVRRAAAESFKRIKDERSITALIAALDDPSSEVRAVAASALGKQGDARGIAPLVRSLRDGKSRVRGCAAHSLRKLGWMPAGKSEHAMFEIAIGNPKGAMSAGADAVEPLASEMSCNTSLFRRAVAEVLKDVKDPRAAECLLKAAKSDGDVTVKVAAIYSLAGLKDKQGIPVLQLGLRDEDPRVRGAAVSVLAQQADASHAPCFMELLKDGHYSVRLAAVNFLAKLRDPKITESLVPMIADNDHDVREATIKAVGEMRCTAATEALVVALIDEDPAVRLAAEQALERIDAQWISSQAAQRAKVQLAMFMNDNRSWVRSATVMLLQELETTGGGGMRASA